MTTAVKPWYCSRTVWVNLLVASLLLIEANWPLLDAVLPMRFYQVAAFALPLINLWLRVITTGPIALSSIKPDSPDV